jgi:hypothetical protein
LRSAWRSTALAVAPRADTHGDWQLGRGRRAAVSRCCVALDGDGVGHVLAHLGDEKVPLVAAYVGEARGNEPKLFVTPLRRCMQSPGAKSDIESWWINGSKDWRHASDGLRESYERLGVTSQCRRRSTVSCRSPPLRWSAGVCNCRYPDSRPERLQHSLTMANGNGTHEKRGAHDGVYAARVYRQDRRRLL